MEGIPQDVLDQHRNRIIQNFYQAQEDRRIATGNPPPGQSKNPRKKIKIETREELLKRFAEFRLRKEAGPAASGSAMEGVVPTNPQSGSSFVGLLPGICHFWLCFLLSFLANALESNSLIPLSNNLDPLARPAMDTRQIRFPLAPQAILPEHPAVYHNGQAKAASGMVLLMALPLVPAQVTTLTSSSAWPRQASRPLRSQRMAKRKRTRRARWCTTMPSSVQKSGWQHYLATHTLPLSVHREIFGKWTECDVRNGGRALILFIGER